MTIEGKPTLEKIWKIDPPLPAEISRELNEYPTVLRQLLYNRGITTAEEAQAYLYPTEENYHDPFLMLNMDKAVARILAAVDNGEKIAIYGDYDVDGVTASALMVQALRALGGNAEHYIPDRHTEGYGINSEALVKLKEQGVSLVISVDCGIRSPKEAETALQIRLDLIITDHHEPGEILPLGYAVICPKQHGDYYPFKELAGVGIAFKVVQALYQERPVPGVSIGLWLDLVAVGTVSDVVPLVGENRAMVRHGLNVLSRRQRQGLHSLLGAAGVEPGRKVNAYHIGYMVGPRLNAAGRMTTAEAAYQILMTGDIFEAGQLAQVLDDQNRTRQETTRAIQQAAESMVNGNDPLVFAVSPDFQLGVVGLAAARLVETFYRPAVVGIVEGDTTRASCRSIPEFDITQALDRVAHLLERHGGHAMAAGFTVRNENIPELKSELERIATEELAGIELRPSIHADMELPLSDVHPRILEYQDLIEPTGSKNRGVKFVSRNLRVTRSKKIGSDSSHLRLTVTDGKVTYDAVAFRQAYWADAMPERIDILFSFERNSYQGREGLQLIVQDIRDSKANLQSDI